MAEGTDKIDGEAPALASDEIRARIEDTRQEMSQTIDAIAARVDPRRMVEEGRSAIRDFLNTARDNPVPVAIGVLAGIGVVMLKRRHSARRLRRAQFESSLW